MARFLGHAHQGLARREPRDGALHEQAVAQERGLAPVAAPGQVRGPSDHRTRSVAGALAGDLRQLDGVGDVEGATRVARRLLDGFALIHEGTHVLQAEGLGARDQERLGFRAALGAQALSRGRQHFEARLVLLEQPGGDVVGLRFAKNVSPRPWGSRAASALSMMKSLPNTIPAAFPTGSRPLGWMRLSSSSTGFTRRSRFPPATEVAGQTLSRLVRDAHFGSHHGDDLTLFELRRRAGR